MFTTRFGYQIFEWCLDLPITCLTYPHLLHPWSNCATDQPIPDSQRHWDEHLRQFCGELGLDTGLGTKEDATLALESEVLTHTSAVRPPNHQRLEFLGDAVLRLAACEFTEQYRELLAR